MPDDVDMSALPRGVRAELRGLSQTGASIVGGHLAMAGRLIDEDAALALAHALAARRRASRLPSVREAVAETAYAAGDYTTALAEYRLLNRLTGSADYVPVMANCERALGRPEAALRLVRGVTREDVSGTQYVEVLLETAGARADLGQRDEAMRVLREAIGARVGHRAGQARLRFAYADLLEQAGDLAQARDWYAAAAALDDEGDSEAEDRLERLDGVELVVDEDDEGDSEAEDRLERLDGVQLVVDEDDEGDSEAEDRLERLDGVQLVVDEDDDGDAEAEDHLEHVEGVQLVVDEDDLAGEDGEDDGSKA
ncbi:MAG: hypothetical protein FWC46_02450 [Actinomycetia bacterium]|nr:hypothetical protein [Actinomycetes bacterium]